LKQIVTRSIQLCLLIDVWQKLKCYYFLILRFLHLPLLLKVRLRKLSIAERGALATSIPLACLFLSLGAHILLRQVTLQSERKVEHVQSVLEESRTLLLDLLNAETGVRGYYISHQSEFLTPFYQGITKFPKTFNRIKLLVKNNPKQVQRLTTLDQLSEKKLLILKERASQIQSESSTPGIPGKSSTRFIEGKQIMDRFRSVLAEFEAEEELALTASRQGLQQFRDLNALLVLLSVAIGGIGAAIAAKLFRNLDRELKAGELMLQESNNLIQAIFSNVIDAVVTINTSGQIESCNQAAVTMFDYDRSTLIGRNWATLLGTENQNLILLPAPGKVEEGKVGHLWQTMGQRKNGDYFPVEISISKIELDNSVEPILPERQIVIIRDITLRQQTAAKLQSRAAELAQLNILLLRTNNALEERNQELDRFAYITSHDLKAPLRAIANLSNWISEDLEGELSLENHNQLSLLLGRVSRMEALLNGLLEYSRIGRKSIRIQLTDLNELVQGVINSLNPPNTFHVEIAPNLPTIATRRLLLEKVFLNLIDNAIEHHPSPHGTVKISAVDCGDRYKFVVADDGQGIESQYHERIYNIFQTLQARDTHESTGVGLAIVKKIVETEGGTVQLESSLGQGATFSFTWLKRPVDLAKSTIG
jgi:PAS domain S-box-containing protein